MLPGPVFTFEMLRVARRPRFYFLRAAYALILLLVLAENYYGWTAIYGADLSNTQVARFAENTFYSFAVCQTAVLLALVPSLVAGCVAEEKQRRTLHYLLASDLSGPEIVLGKLAARLGLVITYLLVGLPVLGLLSMLGGVDPRLVLIVFGACFSTTFALASLSILFSVLARRPRDAVFAAYAVEGLWLVAPFALRGLPAWLSPSLAVIHDLVSATNPIVVARDFLWTRLLGGTFLIAPALLTMIAYQSALGLLFAILAAWRLRPVFRRQEGGPAHSFFRRSPAPARPRRRLIPRPECGDDPMRWKELWTSRSGGITRFIGAAASLLLAFFVLYSTAQAIWMMRVAGGLDRLNQFLAGMIATLSIIPCLVALVTAAGSVTSEIEGDTWVSLTSTTLEPREVLRAKLLASVWRARGGLLLIGILWLVGLYRGVIGWPVVLLSALALGVFVVACASLGLLLSLSLPSSHRAQVFGVALLLLLNIAGQASLSAFYRFPPGLYPLCFPIAVNRIQSYWGPIYWIWEHRTPFIGGRGYGYFSEHDTPTIHLAMILLTVVSYAVGAYVCWRLALRRFDTVAGRPRRSRDERAHPLPAPVSPALDPSAPSA